MKLAAVGDNCMDVYANLDKAYPGGNPVNVAVYFKRLGGESSYTGVVGTDKYGDMMINAIKSKGVDVSHISKMEGRTAITQVELVNGERVFGDYDEGVMKNLSLSEDDIDFLCSHDLIVSGLWGNVHRFFYMLKAKGMKIAFDAATRPFDDIVDEAIKHVDYLFFASDIDDNEELHIQMKELYNKGPILIIATLGEKGSIVFDGTKFIQFGIIPCEVIDTMGAGDSYIAGFLKGILENKKIIECMEIGAKNATKTLEYNGAW